MTKLSIAIIGAGIGGLTTASALLRFGIEVQIYEQASRFTRIGAGIQQTPNAIKVLRVLGLEEQLRRVGFRPLTSLNQEWDTGVLTNEYPLGDEIERRFGAPHLLLHRGDLHDVLAAIVPRQVIRLNHKLVGVEQTRTGVRLFFANGARAQADALVGADGIHSLVREIMLGPEKPRFTGRVAYRTTYPASRLGSLTVGDNTKWWGPRSPYRGLLRETPPGGDLFRHQHPRAGVRSRVVVSEGRPRGLARGVRRIPSARPRSDYGLSGGSQVGAGRARPTAPMERGTGGAARRRLPSDDAVYGAGRRHRDGGCGSLVAMSRSNRR